MNIYLFSAVVLLLPALCTALGAAGVFLVRRADEPRTRRMLCGMAAGIMLAASVWSLLLPAIERAEAGSLPVWLAPAAGLVLGAVGLLRLEEAAGRLMHGSGREHGRMGRVVLAVTLHNLPEGMVVGLAAALALRGEPEAVSGALALALGIGLQNIPEGAAVSLPLAQAGQGRRKAFCAGAASGLVEPLGALLALFSVKYGVDQIIIGVVLNVLALGLTTFLYGTIMKDAQDVLNTNRYSLPDLPIPGLVEIPVIGPVLFDQSILVYIMYAAVIALSFFLFRSRWGLRLRACGEHPRAADTVGINVGRTRTANTILGSAVAGLGGAFFTIGSGLAFTDNISAGNGYIALAAMILGKWNPVGAMSAAVMFGFAQAMARMLPNIEPSIPANLISMIPYVVTIIAVAGFVGKSRAPAAENIPYVK